MVLNVMTLILRFRPPMRSCTKKTGPPSDDSLIKPATEKEERIFGMAVILLEFVLIGWGPA